MDKEKRERGTGFLKGSDTEELQGAAVPSAEKNYHLCPKNTFCQGIHCSQGH